MYSSTTVYSKLDLGNWTTATAGAKALQLEVVGKNLENLGYTLVVDYVKLLPN